MSLILVDQRPDGIATLTLNRVDKLNAFSKALMLEMSNALALLEKSSQSRVLFIDSSCPKAFCVGADLGERLVMDEAQVLETLKNQGDLLDRVAALPMATFAIIEGPAFGLGLELALACDFRLARPKILVGLPERLLAIIPGAGGTQRLSRTVGIAKAKEMIFRAQKISSEEALDIGLVNTVSENPRQEAQNWARDILRGGPLSLSAAKNAIDKGWDLNLAEALEWERKCYTQILSSQDRIEGLKAFSEKRLPNFRGQ